MISEYSYSLKIPKDRVAVLIGKKGKIKKQIEAATKTKIKVDSEEGDILVQGKDALNLYSAREVIKSIGRGFNPDISQLLLKQDYVFEQINLKDYVKSKNHFKRLKGRIIGSEGKARRTIEGLSETNICVYGKTIGIIGQAENVTLARLAIDSLLSGSPHSNVYRWLEKKRQSIR